MSDGGTDGGTVVDVIAWALVPVAGMLFAATAAVLIVGLALKGTASRDRATVLSAIAKVIRAVRGRR
ncbi:hypothetical protein GCM10010330_77370 [Streptomyces tendae]|uniref:hypothetical protein n=1 Tax=Streptomyces tendae TaxID=1932 RepID=UPI0016785B53|nr:hypothetical protein [Streptomyces tendae]GHB11779.1 hypothetical protein GCM10010330_77370 [Streptomyces tendae]